MLVEGDHLDLKKTHIDVILYKTTTRGERKYERENILEFSQPTTNMKHIGKIDVKSLHVLKEKPLK